MSHRVAVVEDNATYRQTISQLLAHGGEFKVAASFSNPSELLRIAGEAAADGRDPGWDLVVMDLEMPVMNGIEATRRLKALLPSLRVLVLTVFENPATILEAISAGADGYLLKRARAAELLEGLRSLGAGGAPLTPDVARTVLEFVKRAPQADSGSAEPSRLDLTEREQQVLRALVEGLSYKQVADVLGITLGTVRTHVVAVYRKLQVHSVAEAVSRAIREHIV